MNSSSITLFLKLFLCLRPLNLLILVLSLLLTASLLKGSFLTTDLNLWLIIGAVVFAAAGGYLVNDLSDVEIDTLNKPGKNPVGNFIKPQTATLLYGVLVALSTAAGFFAGLVVGVLTVLSNLLLWTYSKKLSGLPLVGNLCVSALSALAMAMPVFIYGTPESPYFVIFIGFAFLLSLVRELIKDAEDVEGDSISGRQTICVVNEYIFAKVLKLILYLLYFGVLSAYAWCPGQFMRYFMLLTSFGILTLHYMVIMHEKAADEGKTKGRDGWKRLSLICKALMLWGLVGIYLASTSA